MTSNSQDSREEGFLEKAPQITTTTELDEAQKILSDLTVYMKYSRYLPELQRRETWSELVTRNKEMHIKKFPFIKDEIEENYQLVYDKKVLPSMRSLQFSGKPIEVSPNRLFNCAYLPIDHLSAFSETMFLLLGGTGVGYSVQKHHVEKLPDIKKPNINKNRRFLVSDSIEGWADAIKVLMKAYFGVQSSNPVFDFSDIRPKGSRLVTSGGKAPGPQPLKDCIHNIKSILDDKQDGAKLTPLEVHDIVCHIADAVLAGGIRRAALISLFSANDMEMISCKSGPWWEKNPQRGRANNSAVLLRHKVTEPFFKELWKRIEASGAGEPGIYLSNDKDDGTNPCVEIALRPNQFCLSKDTLILTDEGYQSIEELLGKEQLPKVISNYADDTKGISDVSSFSKHDFKIYPTGTKPVFEIKTHRGPSIKATGNHQFLTQDGYVAVEDLDIDYHNLFMAQDDAGVRYEFAKAVTIESIEYVGEEEVFDLTVEDSHNFIANGLITHNCNLVETNVSNLQSQEDFNKRVKTAAFIATLQAAYTDFHYLRDVWKKTTEKEALIGVSMTGIGSGVVLKHDMTEAAEVIKKENERVAKLIGINKAARTSCVKPAGTTSLTLGTSSGVHAWHNDYYIRRLRVGKDEAIYKYMKETIPELVEDEYFRPHDTAVISIPQKAPQGAILRTESALDLLERVKKISIDWIKPGHRSGSNSHNVSATVSLKPEEWEIVGEWMWENREHYNGLSVLPYDGGTYIQAPFEDCTKEEYERLFTKLKSVDLTKVIEIEDETNLNGEIACGAAGCEVK